jgi:hypothetical protein
VSPTSVDQQAIQQHTFQQQVQQQFPFQQPFPQQQERFCEDDSSVWKVEKTAADETWEDSRSKRSRPNNIHEESGQHFGAPANAMEDFGSSPIPCPLDVGVKSGTRANSYLYGSVDPQAAGLAWLNAHSAVGAPAASPAASMQMF